jgi:hypothetical protein
MELIKIVVRYLDERIVKGYSRDFFPNKSSFHVELLSEKDKRTVVEVHLNDLKAVFFVKDFKGNSSHNEQKYFPEGQQITGRKIKVSFKDGEVLVGTTMGYDPQRVGFFLFPADPLTNNLKVFVMSSAVSKVEFLLK